MKIKADRPFWTVLFFLIEVKLFSLNGNLKFININHDKNDSADLKKYKILLNLEYTFCLKIIDQIITKISRLYEKQMKTGKIIKFCCNFKLLEQKCDEWE